MRQVINVTVKGAIKESRKALVVVSFIVIVLVFFLLWRWLSHHSSEVQKETKRSNVLIFATARTGSSFLGEIFNQHPEVFYLYEPLHAYSMLERLRVFKPSKLQHHSLSLLQDAFECNFSNHEMYLNFISHPGFSPPHFRSSSQALSTPPLCYLRANYSSSDSWKFAKDQRTSCEKRLEPRATNFVCHSRKQVVIKVLSHRLFLAAVLRRLMHSNKFHLKVIHLVRDPRAIVSSRLRLGWISWNSDGIVQIREICHRMRENIHMGRDMSSKNSEKYLVMRYEDLVNNTLPVVRKLFNHVGLEMTKSVEQWVLRNTRWPSVEKNLSKTLQPFKTEERDALKTMSSWRRNIQMDVVQTVEENCESFMKKAGYRKAVDVNDLRAENSSLLVSPSETVLPWFFK